VPIAAIRSALSSKIDGVEIVELARILLRLCREHIAGLSRDLEDPMMQSQRRRLRGSAADLFKQIDDEVLEPGDIEATLNWLEWATGECGSARVAIRAAADGLDAALGARFAGCFRHQRTIVGPNEPCPVSHPPLRELLGQLTTHPDRLTDPLDGMKSLRIAPNDLGRFELVVDGRLGDQLALLQEKGRSVVALTAGAISEYEWEEFDRHDEHFFYGVRPRDGKRHLDEYKRLLKDAGESAADIVVFPELCLRIEAMQEALEYCRNLPQRPMLVVAGSSHTPSDLSTPGRNEAYALLRGHRDPLVHQKLTRFELRNHEGGEVRSEFIATDVPRITLYLSGGWSFTFVICKDFLDLAVVRILTDLRVRLALVPSMSEKTEMFEQRARELALNSQCIVLIANTPGSPDAATAILARPTREAPLVVRGAADQAPPCLQGFDPFQKENAEVN
jgi:predicted amidohydrolase